MSQEPPLEDRFFELSIDMLCQLDFNGYFKRLNPAWERTLGFTIAELMSRPFIEFVHPDDRERTLNQNSDVRGGGHALGFENRYLCKDGSYRWFLWNAAPDCIAVGDLLGGARHHGAEGSRGGTRTAGARAAGGARRGEDAPGDPADLLVLPEDPR